MKIDYEVRKVTESSGMMQTDIDENIICPLCGKAKFAVRVDVQDYIDLLCSKCNSVIHVTAIEGK